MALNGRQPLLSVVLLVAEQRERGVRCLRSLLEQSMVERLEVVLVDASRVGTAPLRGSDHPCVRVHRARAGAGAGKVGELKAAGVREATAPIIAFIEEHCVALPGWAEALVRALEGSAAAAVSGERRNPAPGQPLARFIHLLDDGPWTEPATPAKSPFLPEGNVAYKREVLMGRRDLGVWLECEGLLFARMRAEGLELEVAPDARYLHEYDTSLLETSVRWFWQGFARASSLGVLAGWTGRQRLEVALASVRHAGQPVALMRRLAGKDPARREVLRENLAAAVLYVVCPLAGDLVGTLLGGRVRSRLAGALLSSRRAG